MLSEKEVVIYSGHARYGSGPDFDSKKSMKENFVIGVNSALHEAGDLEPSKNKSFNKKLEGMGNDLQRMSEAGKFDPDKYQIWFMNACISYHYLDEIRGGLVKGKDRSNLRYVGTTKDIFGDAIPMLAGLLKQKSMRVLLRIMNRSD